MECPNCQASNRSGARFCATCGSQLPETESQAAAEPEPQHPELAVECEASPEEQRTPLPAGAVLAERYEIVALVSTESEGNVYVALDLARCAVCGFDDNAPDDEFCANCGAALDSPPQCEIREQAEPAAPGTDAKFDADGRTYAVIAHEAAPPEDDTAPAGRQSTRLNWAAQTDVGQVRELNEDYVDAHVYASHAGPTMGLFVVADGVGGQAAGEVASQLATHIIWEAIRETVWRPAMQGERVLPETIEARLGEAVQAANQAVYQQRTEQHNDMSTTVTLALVCDTIAVIANVGDSRTYRWNADGLRQLTVDHSLVQSLIDAGEIEPDGVYTHPQRNIIYRSVGDRPRIEVDTFVEELAPGDRLLLCSDGLWEMARGDGIEEILLREPDPQRACEALVERANLAGGSDNISAIVVNVSS
ncbi:MAG: Serine/threonine phosphatase stp [Anaerolineales bacterium]|nr:Serine/threonine phosphatase stp [Anaerolineales bacterium]